MHEWISTDPPDNWRALTALDGPESSGVVAPSGWHEATAEDGHRLRVVVWGDGSAPAPYCLNLYCVRPAAKLRPPGRWPTFPELAEAMAVAMLEGAVCNFPPMTAGGDIPPAPEVFTVIQVQQVGAIPNTPAGDRMKLTGGIALGSARPPQQQGLAT